MNRSYRIWYALALLLTLIPPGVRLLLWQRGTSQFVDPSMARAGEALFKHEWKPKDALSSEGDGLGPVFNATSCAACHNKPVLGGAGELEHNVTTFTVRRPGDVREGVVHSNSTAVKETLRDVHPDFPPISKPNLEQLVVLSARNSGHCLQFPTGVHLSQRNTPSLFGCKLIDEIPERVILAQAKAQQMKWGMAPADDESVPVGRALKLANGKVGRFGWKAQMASLSDFVQAACANELGLGNPGQKQPVAIYHRKGTPRPVGHDLTQLQCDQLTAYCASLSRPVERLPQNVSAEQASAGKQLFTTVGCAACHVPNLGDVDGIYSDLLLHRMGQDLVGGGSYGEPPIPIPETKTEGPSPSEWRTPPLWGVAYTAPYLHDGRAATLEDAIRMHGGQGKRSADNFAALKPAEKAQLIAFLRTLATP